MSQCVLVNTYTQVTIISIQKRFLALAQTAIVPLAPVPCSVSLGNI